MLDKSEKIFVAGHRGMVGSAIVRRLESEGFSNLLVRDRPKLDLSDESAVAKFFADEKASCRHSRGGKSRRHQGKQRLSGRVSAREFADPEQRHSFGLRERRTQTSLPWKLVYLPEARAAADPGNSVAELDRWNQPTKLTRLRRLPGSSFARRTLANMARISFQLMPTNLLRSQRQFRFGNITRRGCALAQSARS